MEYISSSGFEQLVCRRLQRVGKPFFITQGRAREVLFVAFPVVIDGVVLGPESAQLIHSYALEWGADCKDEPSD